MIPADLLDKLREKDPEPFPPIQFKVCTKCHINKPVAEFGIIKRDNCLKSWCKECCKNHCTQKRREQGILPQKGCKRSEEFKKRASEANYKKWSDPEYKKKLSEIHKKRYSDPEERQKLSERMHIAMTDEFRIKISRARRAALEDPIEQERLKQIGAKRWEDPEEHRKQSEWSKQQRGEKHPAWKGGISFEPYCPEFNKDLKEKIRIRFSRRCFLCGVPENGKHHCVHHVDYNKNAICNGKSWALVPLCGSCHSKTNANRWYWFNLLINYWMYNGEISFRRLDIWTLY